MSRRILPGLTLLALAVLIAWLTWPAREAGRTTAEAPAALDAAAGPAPALDEDQLQRADVAEDQVPRESFFIVRVIAGALGAPAASAEALLEPERDEDSPGGPAVTTRTVTDFLARELEFDLWRPWPWTARAAWKRPGDTQFRTLATESTSPVLQIQSHDGPQSFIVRVDTEAVARFFEEEP